MILFSVDAIICESLDLPVLMLFSAGNTGIAKCSVVHKNTSELSQKVLPLLERLKSQKRTFWHRFREKGTVPESTLFGTVLLVITAVQKFLHFERR